MKTLYSLMFLVVLLFTTKPTLAQSIELLDAQNGFMGHTFGTDISKFSGLELDVDGEFEKIYSRKSDQLEIDGNKMLSIQYYFYDNKLMGISILTDGESSSNAFLKAIESMYGKGTLTDTANNRYEWNGEVVSMVHQIKSSTPHIGLIAVISNYLYYEMSLKMSEKL